MRVLKSPSDTREYRMVGGGGVINEALENSRKFNNWRVEISWGLEIFENLLNWELK